MMLGSGSSSDEQRARELHQRRRFAARPRRLERALRRDRDERRSRPRRRRGTRRARARSAPSDDRPRVDRWREDTS